MELSFSAISHGAGSLAYLLVAIYIFTRYFRRSTDRAMFLATLLSSIWLGVLFLQSFQIEIPFYIRYTIELARNAAWFGVLYALLDIHFAPSRSNSAAQFYLTSAILVLLAGMLFITLYEGISGEQLITGYALLILQIAVSLVGLLLLEQVWRNASVYSRSGIKYMSVAIASLFGYDFFMYSDALLFQQLSSTLWDSRGAINAFCAPFIALTMINSRKQPIGMHVSRQMVFHTTTFVIAGIYLMFISIGGYYISIFGGTWGEALRTLFIFVGLIALVLMISSPVLRARIMVFISKNFFDYKYDYRDEWINSTNAFSKTKAQRTLHNQIIQVLGSLVGCQSGAIWCLNDEGTFVLREKLNTGESKLEDIHESSDIVSFFKEHDWIINIEEYMIDPTKYHLIEIPDAILSQEHPWLIIPLGQSNHLVGIVMLGSPVAPIDLNWENYDLMRIVAQQAASYLAQTVSQEKLAEASQFEAVNKTSAFLVHDIKTIIAQLSLLVKNAEKHKKNPEFIEDMIRTTHHTVEKMEHLLNQIRNPNTDDDKTRIDLNALLLEIYHTYRNSSPAPSLEYPETTIYVQADKEHLRSAITHIVQNAVDATEKEGDVSITVKNTDEHAFIFIQDTGTGMSEEYINNSLFKPFESTKGLTGMGIGVYQSREYLRKLGGAIDVTSELEVGTCFTLKLPIEQTSH